MHKWLVRFISLAWFLWSVPSLVGLYTTFILDTTYINNVGVVNYVLYFTASILWWSYLSFGELRTADAVKQLSAQQRREPTLPCLWNSVGPCDMGRRVR